MARPKGSKNPTAGRKKGVPNKLTTDLKQMILAAMEAAGGDAGSQGYLEEQARKNPNAFLTLIGKILPTQVTGDSGGPVISRVEFVVVDPES